MAGKNSNVKPLQRHEFREWNKFFIGKVLHWRSLVQVGFIGLFQARNKTVRCDACGKGTRNGVLVSGAHYALAKISNKIRCDRSSRIGCGANSGKNLLDDYLKTISAIILQHIFYDAARWGMCAFGASETGVRVNFIIGNKN